MTTEMKKTTSDHLGPKVTRDATMAHVERLLFDRRLEIVSLKRAPDGETTVRMVRKLHPNGSHGRTKRIYFGHGASMYEAIGDAIEDCDLDSYRTKMG